MVPVVLVVLAGTVRFAALDTPRRLYFDEVYYAHDARSMLQRGVEVERPAHPPLGKWLIAAGIGLAGFDSVGWRLASATAGTSTVLVTYLGAWRVFRRRWPAALAALLVAIDGLALTTSRIAMLDVFLGLFVITGFWLLLVAHDHAGRAATARLALAGVAFGMALATKWSGLFAIAGALLLFLGVRLARARRESPAWRPAAAAAAMALVCLLVVPALVYVASYAGWFVRYEESDAGRDRCPDGGCDVGVAVRGRVWWEEQLELVDYHRRLPTTHPYRSSPVTWPVMARPVLFYFERCTPEDPPDTCVVDAGNRAKILGIGNPAVWWSALLAYPVVAWCAAVRRRPEAAAIAVFLLAQYVPWLAVGKDGYLFYATPLVPFIAMSVAYLCTRAARWSPGRWLPGVVVGLAVASFAFFLPVWYGVEAPRALLDDRIWFRSWR